MINKKILKIKLLICLFLILIGSYFSYQVERDFGRIDVTPITIMSDDMIAMSAKIYRPVAATSENPMPGLLALHGYQSDKEATTTFGTLEFARRGFVVVSIDQYGHGYSDGDANAKNASGSSNGYKFLKNLPFVDHKNIGIFGHSTGALNAIRVAQENPDHKAVNGQSSNGGNPNIRNYLLTQGRYEELAGYREGIFPTSALSHHPKRLAAFGMNPNDVIEWNKTYGDFSNGSARRADLVDGTHLGVMVNGQGTVGAIDWFNATLQNGIKGADWIDANNHIYQWREIFCLLALVATLYSILPLTQILLSTEYFSPIVRPLIHKNTTSTKKWWIFSFVSILITAITYPLLVQKGGPGEPIASFVSWMPLEMGNGIVTWLIGGSLIYFLFFFIWRKNKSKDGFSLNDLGLELFSNNLNIKNLGKTVLLALIIFAWTYVLVCTAYWLWGVEFRFLWPFLKPFSSRRFGLFLIYFWPALIFFIAVSLVLFGVLGQPKHDSPRKTVIIWGLKNSLITSGGLILLWCIHFIPNYMGIGPGFDVLGFPQYGGRWMMMLAVIIPQVIVYTFLLSWFYVRTGRIYLGSFVVAIFMMWILTAGQVIGRFLA